MCQKILRFTYLLPLILTVVGIALIVIANIVIDFNKEQFHFKENRPLVDFYEKTTDKKNFWNQVVLKSQNDNSLAKNFSDARMRYFESKVAIGVSSVVTAFSLLILLIVSIVVFNYNIRRLSAGNKTIANLACSAISISIATVLWTSNPLTVTGPIEELVSKIKAFGDGSIVVVIGQGVAAIAAVSVIWLVFACCSLLCKSHDLPTKMYQAKLLLGISSLALASGVLINYFFHSWSAAIVEDGRQVIKLANTLTVSVGILFTFLLLLLFTPIALIHQYWNAKNNSKTEPAIEWKSILREFVTTLVPILVAVIAQWLGYKS